MQANEERLIERMWVEFSLGKTVTNSVCSDFFFMMIRPDRNLSHLNAFEVLDTIVNCDLPVGHAKKKRPRRPIVPRTKTPLSTPVVGGLVGGSVGESVGESAADPVTEESS